MHILLIHQAFAALNEPGGTRHHELARYLTARGHQVTIIASPISYLTGNRIQAPSTFEEMEGNIRIYRTYTYPALHKSFFHRVISFISFMISSFLKTITIKNVDLIWGTTPPIFQSLTAWVAAKIKCVPFLLEVRDLWPEFAIAVGVLRNPLLIRLSFRLERFLYRHADKIMVNSPGFIEPVAKQGGKNIHVIPNGADISQFPAIEQKTARKKQGWPDQFIVLYAGAHGMSNDLEILLKSAEELRSNNEIAFYLIGDGKEKTALMNKAQEMGLENVTFLEPVAKNFIAETLAGADACVAILKPIELYKTTYPNKVFDYMAASKPVILAIDGVIREVVEKSGCGIFCPPGNHREISKAIEFLYNNQSAARLMGKRGREYLSMNFDRMKIAGQLSELMKELVEKNG